jgi:uncharacterized surface anchored protein
MAFIDIYTIGYSPQFAITGREEITENLDLTQNALINSGNLTGTVTSGGVGIQGATVKVYDVNDNPIEHTNTGGNGQYTIANLPPGSYKVTAIEAGYLLPVTIPISIQANKTTTANIVLIPDPDAGLSVIYGIVRSSLDGLPITNAIVNLFHNKLPDPTLIATAPTNDRGQYIFGLIPAGDYFATASKLGFFPSETALINVTSGELIDSDLTLAADAQANTGTISGFIKELTTGLPIEGAGVALYSISGGVESIVAITRTNVVGRYLFANVSPGTYLVKSTKQEVVA